MAYEISKEIGSLMKGLPLWFGHWFGAETYEHRYCVGLTNASVDLLLKTWDHDYLNNRKRTRRLGL